MSRVPLTVLCWLLFIFKETQCAGGDCIFTQDLTVGNTYYVYNSEYPYPYTGEQDCTWSIKSDYRINLNCATFELPWSFECFQDSVSVEVNSTTSLKYCGSNAFNITSDGPTMVVKLSAENLSARGRFFCEANAVERPQDSEECRCGWKNPSRIVGGVNTGVNEFPMMAALINADLGSTLYCGSTIISNRYVVSAGSCVVGRDAANLGVLVGDHDISTGADTNATVLHRVTKIILHPKYVSGGAINDIAVVKTEGEIVFNNQVGPACLPFQHQPDTFAGSYVEVLGWGAREFGQGPTDTLQKATLRVLTSLQCSKILQNVTTSSLCTFAEGKDACQLDSGGPVLWQNPSTKRIVLAGIISSGSDCGITARINTRVGAYIDWIVSVTQDASYCISE